MTTWQPISTAPKDGTPVDIWRPSFGGERLTNMKREDLGNGNVFYSPVAGGPCCVRDATHWMPIPCAPSDDKMEQRGMLIYRVLTVCHLTLEKIEVFATANILAADEECARIKSYGNLAIIVPSYVYFHKSKLVGPK